MRPSNIITSAGFVAFARSAARVLILGSLPGPESLRRGVYDAHPRNAFWPVMGKLLGDSGDQTYTDRIRPFRENQTALGDACAAADRRGSCESDLSCLAPNDFNEFFDNHPDFELSWSNGMGGSESCGRKVLPTLAPKLAEIHREVLPSPSPAGASLSFTGKLRYWKKGLDSAFRPGPLPRASFKIRVLRLATDG